MKSKYETHVVPRFDEIAAWCRDGVSEENIANNLGVAYSTFREYREKYPALSALLTRTKDYVDNVEVVGALQKAVLGHTVVLRSWRKVWNPDTKTWDEIEERREQYYPPNTQLMNLWLKTRQRERWKEQDDVVYEESDQPVIVIPDQEEPVEEGGDPDGTDGHMGTTA